MLGSKLVNFVFRRFLIGGKQGILGYGIRSTGENVQWIYKKLTMFRQVYSVVQLGQKQFLSKTKDQDQVQLLVTERQKSQVEKQNRYCPPKSQNS